MFKRLAPCLLVLVPAPGLAQTCTLDRLDLAGPIADTVRAYVVCGMFTRGQTDLSRDGRSIDASIYGPNSPTACATVRANAVREADRTLQPTMPNQEARERFIAAALEDADHFIATLPASDAVGIDPIMQPAPCAADQTRTSNAPDR